MSIWSRAIKLEGVEVRGVNPLSSAAKGSSTALGTVNRYSPGQAVATDFGSSVAVNNAYLADIYVHRCVLTIANQIGALEVRAGKDPEKPNDFRIDSPLATLLGPAPGSPNPQMSAAQLIKLAVASYLVMGKFAWEKVYDDRGRVNGLWPLQAQYLDPIPNTNPASASYFSGYSYLLPGMDRPRIMREQDVVYIWRPSMADFRKPESVIQAANLNVSVHRLIEQYEYAFLKNNATPATMVVTAPFAEPEQRRGFRDQFVAEFSGVANAGKTVFLESEDNEFDGTSGNAGNGLSVQRLGSTHQEMQMDLLRDAKIRDICVAFRVPLSVLGDSSLAKFTNMEQDWKNFWRGTLKPLLSELEDAINIYLAQDIGDELLWFDITDVAELQEVHVPLALTPDLMKAVLMNLITEDEARASIGLPPRDSAEKKAAPIVAYPTATPGVFGMQVDTAAQQVEKGALEAKAKPEVPATGETKPPPLPLGSGEPAALPAGKVTPLAIARSRRARQLEGRHAGHDGHLPIPAGHVHSGTTDEHQRKAVEALLTASVQAMYAEQKRSVTSRLGGRRGRRAQVQATADTVFDATAWEQRWVDLFAPVLSTVADAARAAGSARLLGELVARNTADGLELAMAGYDPDNSASYLAAVGTVFDRGPEWAMAQIATELNNLSATAA